MVMPAGKVQERPFICRSMLSMATLHSAVPGNLVMPSFGLSPVSFFWNSPTVSIASTSRINQPTTPSPSTVTASCCAAFLNGLQCFRWGLCPKTGRYAGIAGYSPVRGLTAPLPLPLIPLTVQQAYFIFVHDFTRCAVCWYVVAHQFPLSPTIAYTLVNTLSMYFSVSGYPPPSWLP